MLNSSLHLWLILVLEYTRRYISGCSKLYHQQHTSVAADINMSIECCVGYWVLCSVAELTPAQCTSRPIISTSVTMVSAGKNNTNLPVLLCFKMRISSESLNFSWWIMYLGYWQAVVSCHSRDWTIVFQYNIRRHLSFHSRYRTFQ